MCGIFCRISRYGHHDVPESMKSLLSRRGPDTIHEHKFEVNGVYVSLVCSVLSMRGPCVVPQPLINSKSGSILCWNGEAWKIGEDLVSENDSQRAFSLLISAASDTLESEKAVLAAFSKIRGPFAYVFYDGTNQRLYFGRDCLGRRSLVRRIPEDGDITVASVSDPNLHNAWVEVEADGLYMLPLRTKSSETSKDAFTVQHVPLSFSNDIPPSPLHFVSIHTPSIWKGLKPC